MTYTIHHFLSVNEILGILDARPTATLAALVDRPGVQYVVLGHSPKKPVAKKAVKAKKESK